MVSSSTLGRLCVYDFRTLASIYNIIALHIKSVAWIRCVDFFVVLFLHFSLPVAIMCEILSYTAI